MKTVAVTNVTH